MSKYVKKISKFAIPVKDGDYEFNNAPKNLNILYNNGNTVSNVIYYEYIYDEEKGQPETTKYYFKVVTVEDKNDIEVPLSYNFVCAIKDGTAVHFIYSYSPGDAVFGKFMDMFGGF